MYRCVFGTRHRLHMPCLPTERTPPKRMGEAMTPNQVKALAEWNSEQPAWTPIKTYKQLTPAQQSVIDDRAIELEVTHATFAR